MLTHRKHLLILITLTYTDNPVLRGHIWDKEKVVL